MNALEAFANTRNTNRRYLYFYHYTYCIHSYDCISYGFGIIASYIFGEFEPHRQLSVCWI